MLNDRFTLYLASRAKQSVKRSFNAGTYLKAEIAKLQRQVQEAESAAETYRSTHNLFASGSGTQRGTLNNAQLTDLTRELTRAQTQKSEAEAKAKTIRQLMRRGSADASPEVLRSPLIQQLKAQRVRVERQISELSATLLPAHPRMRQMRADLIGLNRQINNEIRKVADSLEKGVHVAALRVKSIQASIDTLKSQVRDSSGNVAKLAELERIAKAKRLQLESLQARYQTALVRQQTSAIPLEAEIFSKARPSTIPTTKKGPITALAMAGTFLLGLAFVITKELLTGSRSGGGAPNRRRRASDRNEKDFAVPQQVQSDAYAAGAGYATGVRPAASASYQPTLAGMKEPASEYPVASDPSPSTPNALPPNLTGPLLVDAGDQIASYSDMGAVARHIANSGGASGGRRTLIAADAAGTDAGEEAVDLASRLAASSARVILVDWSPSVDGLARQLQLPARPGINELLLGTANFEDVIKRLPGSEVHFIASGEAVSDRTVLDDADRLNLVLDALDEAYDHILVHGTHKDASALFEAIQGRFDVGLTVVSGKRRPGVLEDAPGSFLGFDVSDLDIVQYHRDVLADGAGQIAAGGKNGELGQKNELRG